MPKLALDINQAATATVSQLPHGPLDIVKAVMVSLYDAVATVVPPEPLAQVVERIT